MKEFFMNVLNVFSDNGEEEHKAQVERRSNNTYFMIGGIFILFMAVMFYRSAVVEGVNKEADALKEKTTKQADVRSIVAGDIYDRDGTLLVAHTKKGQSGTYIDGTLYSPLIGYLREKKDGGTTTDFAGHYEYSRLLQYYTVDKPTLFKTTDINSDKGCSLVLTLDHELQTEVERLLTKEMGTEARGSAVVMDAKTGEILASVSHPSYDANDLSASLDKLNKAPKEEEVFYPISHKGAVNGGSSFKIITAVAALDHGLEDFTAVDNNYVIGTTPIVNSYGSTGKTIGYLDAFSRSSNVFFSKIGLELGKDRLEQTAKKFLLGEEIELDFGTINSNWSLKDTSPEKIAMTAFGQGDTLFSTIYAAMMTQTIANDGVMMEPYLIREIKGSFGETVSTGQEKVLSAVTSKETADKVTEAMVAATKSHLHVVEGEENREIYETYEIASKTGTGENGDTKDSNNAWLVSFAPASDPQYVVVANQCKTTKAGQDLMDTVAGIYDYLFEIRSGNGE